MTAAATERRVEGFIVATDDLQWAWGPTIAEAKAAVRRRGARIAKRIVYRLPAGAHSAWVDQMGAIRWEWTDDAPDRTATGEYVRKECRGVDLP